MALARARRCGPGARDDLLAGLGVDAHPSVLGRSCVRTGDRVPVGRPRHRPSGPAAAAARCAAGPGPRRLVLQPVSDSRSDRRRRLRADRRRSGRPGRPGIPRLARAGAPADDRVRARVRVGVRAAVPAASQSASGARHGTCPAWQGCSNDPARVAMGSARGLGPDPRRPRLAVGHRPVPRRRSPHRRPRVGGRSRRSRC